jgi:hypothetical protein
MPRKNWLWLGLIVFALVFLVSCYPLQSSDIELSLHPDQAWDLQVRMVFDPLDDPSAAVLIQQYLQETISQVQAQGVVTEWVARDPDAQGYLPYEIKMEGQGYELLNNALFNPGTFILDTTGGKNQIRFSASSSQFGLGEAVQSTFQLNAGKIIATNGVQKGSNSIVWQNQAGQLEAVFYEPTRSTTGFLVVILVLALAVGSYFGYRRFQQSKPVPQRIQNYTIPAPPRRFCQNCGASCPPEAVFCPDCGAKQI